jgi:hypothetical protein
LGTNPACRACFAVTAILTKKFTASESTSAVLWMFAMQPVANSSARVGLRSKFDRAKTLRLATIRIGGPLSHFCLTNAYLIGDATGVVPVDFPRIPRIAFIGWRLPASRSTRSCSWAARRSSQASALVWAEAQARGRA